MDRKTEELERAIDRDTKAEADRSRAPAKRRYEAPRVVKKRSVARVTLFSGGGATAGGLTASG